MNVEDTTRQRHDQFPLAKIFFVTTLVAMGLGLCVQRSHLAAQRLGVGILLACLARGLFALSRILPKGAQEALFLLGLPFYLTALWFGLWSIVAFLTPLVPALAPR